MLARSTQAAERLREDGRMEKKGEDVGASGGVLESLQAPSETQWVAEAVAEITHQVCTRPKVRTEWLSTGDLYRAEEDFRC